MRTIEEVEKALDGFYKEMKNIALEMATKDKVDEKLRDKLIINGERIRMLEWVRGDL